MILLKLRAGTLASLVFLLSVSAHLSLLAQIQSKKGETVAHTFASVNYRRIACHLSPPAFKNNPALVVCDTTKKNDRDADGIPDSLDKCPDEKGVIQYDGCPVPDSDKDGVADDADACPTVVGLAKYKGCPAPDKDGDKINDDEDRCPDQPGVARYAGCPVGDGDHDGVNDDDDKCIDVPGPAENSGCPAKKQAVKKRKA